MKMLKDRKSLVIPIIVGVFQFTFLYLNIYLLSGEIKEAGNLVVQGRNYNLKGLCRL